MHHNYENHLEFEDGTDPIQMHIFKVHSYSGEPLETEEMKPQWFTIDQIPFRQMCSDDVYWMPMFLKGKKFIGRFRFDRPSTADYQARIVDRELEKVEIVTSN